MLILLPENSITVGNALLEKIVFLQEIVLLQEIIILYETVLQIVCY
jgi:hypothetical protein